MKNCRECRESSSKPCVVGKDSAKEKGLKFRANDASDPHRRVKSCMGCCESSSISLLVHDNCNVDYVHDP